jgi:hypothetical protein
MASTYFSWQGQTMRDIMAHIERNQRTLPDSSAVSFAFQAQPLLHYRRESTTCLDDGCPPPSSQKKETDLCPSSSACSYITSIQHQSLQRVRGNVRRKTDNVTFHDTPQKLHARACPLVPSLIPPSPVSASSFTLKRKVQSVNKAACETGSAFGPQVVASLRYGAPGVNIAKDKLGYPEPCRRCERTVVEG